MFWLSIDVGGAVLGWALWYNDKLVACGLSRTKLKDCRYRAHAHRENILGALTVHRVWATWPARVVVEMGDWRGKSTARKMTPQQLADFNLIAGFLGTHWYSVKEWKGGASRATEQGRTRAALHHEELALLDAIKPTSLAHNACSAVGIGLAFLKRAHVPAGAACHLDEEPTTPGKPARKTAGRRATSRGKTSRKTNARTGVTSRKPRSTRRSVTPARPAFRMSDALVA